MKSEKIIAIISVIVVLVVLFGEVYAYTFNTSTYSSDIDTSSGFLEYSVSSGGSDTYSVLVMDNGSYERNQTVYIYYDEEYASDVQSVQIPVGAKKFTEDYYISQLIKMLEYRGITDVRILNASDLRDTMLNDILADDTTKALVVLSGVLPSTIYEGKSYTGMDDDVIQTWIRMGGSLYWAGNLLGAYYADGNEKISVVDYQSKFFSVTDYSCFNDGTVQKAYGDVTENDYRYSLSLMNNDLRYSIDVSKIIGSKSMAVGYIQNGYSSTALVECGKGMVCVLAGDYSNNQRNDLAQMISSEICYQSVTLYYKQGSVSHGTVSEKTDLEVSKSIVYIYFGGYYPVYAKTTEMV